jgi:IclR family pca regulon transcriptional regulator
VIDKIISQEREDCLKFWWKGNTMTDETTDVKENYIVSSLVRGLKILSTFTVRKPALKVSEIAEMTGFDQATVYRFVYTLEKLGYLVREDETKRYHQSIKMLTISLPAREGIPVREIALPIMDDLSNLVNETVTLDILDGVDVVTIAVAEIVNKVFYRSRLGQHSPSYCTSRGKVLLAYQPIETWERLIDKIEFVAHTDRTIVDLGLFREELMRTRQQGYAIEDGELIVGLSSIAAPVFDHHGFVAAAINLSGLSMQILHTEKTEYYIGELLKSARAISVKMGYLPDLFGAN